ncbi:MAG: branched-chain amino acid transaminase [Myxococcales bacterium]|nr:branched-chain amino acid transaminase [Myxococcales bacterium]MCB9530687.1 branched-chain amino acid transaminase [Myxococcales bacterium]MCB9533608.1 branched-chain amino acid transaminase [Myxococcales bacterium]
MVKKAEKIWLDGEFVNWDAANVHVLTHTLHYGLGAFEGIRCYERADGRSQVFRLREHVRRLFESARLALMKIPFTEEEVREACKETLRVNGQRGAYLRPLAFVGDGAMGLNAIDNPTRLAIVTWEWGTYLGEGALERGIHAKVSSFTRNHPNSLLSKGKIVGHYVNSILAKREAVLAGYDEAIMLDHQGLVSEASGENIFIVRDGVVKTPPYSSSILGGITRDSLIQIMGRLGIPVTYGSFARDELYLADEVFFCGTAAEVTPVCQIDNRVIGAGSRGDVTRRVQDFYFDVVRGSSDAFGEWLDWV